MIALPVRVGYTVGVYDLFHVGHLHHLLEARARCDRLVVGVLSDDAAQLRYGARPVVPSAGRIAVIAGLTCVDDVVNAGGGGSTLDPTPDPYPDLGPGSGRSGRYDVFFVGTDLQAPVGPDGYAAGSARVVTLPAGGETTSSTLLAVFQLAADRRAAA